VMALLEYMYYLTGRGYSSFLQNDRIPLTSPSPLPSIRNAYTLGWLADEPSQDIGRLATQRLFCRKFPLPPPFRPVASLPS